ncbi:MAG: OsmC family protein [Myxococcota bacterium]|jgi:ribosomal protein S12 methylthiotransferase accessory factor
MEMKVTFPGGKRVDAAFNGMSVATDQPAGSGGAGSAPTPFELFQASLATCAGIFVLGFCQSRGISTEGIEIRQVSTFDQVNHRLSKVEIKIDLPKSFPGKYKNAVIAAADQCLVKRTVSDPPEMIVTAEVV